MIKLILALAIVAILYFVVFDRNSKIEEVEKKSEVLYQPQNEKAEGIDPSIHKSNDLGRFGL